MRRVACSGKAPPKHGQRITAPASHRAGRPLTAAIAVAALALLSAALLPASCSAQIAAASVETPPAAQPSDIPAPVRAAFARARLHDLTNLRARGPNYTAEGRTAGGETARIVINGATGAILGLRIGAPELPPAAPHDKIPHLSAPATPH